MNQNQNQNQNQKPTSSDGSPLPSIRPGPRTGGFRVEGWLVGCVLLSGVLVACGGEAEQEATPTPADQFVIVTPTPGTPVPQTPTPRAAAERYVVEAGDSLSGIAAKFGVSLEVLQEANDLDDPNSIFVGQELIIPER